MLEKISRILQKYKYADAQITKTDFTAISIKDGKVESVREGTTENISCRVLMQNSFGFASSNQVGNGEAVVGEAEKLAKLKGGKIKLAQPEANKANLGTKITDNPKNHSFEEKIRLLLEIEKLAKIKRTSSTLLNYYDACSKTNFLNSSGAEISEIDIRTGAAANIFAKDGALLENSYEQVKEKAGFEIMKMFPGKVEKAAKEANSLLAARHGPKGKMMAILDPELAGVFAHEAVGHACEADAIANGSSCLGGKMGRKIGSANVTIKDSPIISPELWGSYQFDDEGTRSRGTTLVKNGILNAYLTSLETANQYKSTLTGNARGDSSSRQIVRMSNTYFEKGGCKREELFDEVKNGIYLVGCKEGQVSPKVGNFTFAAKYGFIIRNGEKKEMVRDCSINGNILTALHKIDMVASDLEFLPGTCGKDGQSAPVTTGAPHLRIREILVG
ncbi:MAG: TldD/PmbA family protein [Candidatus Micrarchaeota archaeon]